MTNKALGTDVSLSVLPPPNHQAGHCNIPIDLGCKFTASTHSLATGLIDRRVVGGRECRSRDDGIGGHGDLSET